jgi:hypothetical protein
VKIKHISLLSFLVVVLAVSGFVFRSYSRPVPVERPTEEILSIIESSTATVVYRVKASGPYFSERIDQYYVIGKGLTPDPKMAKQLKAILLSHLGRKVDPHGPGPKGCPPPVPGVIVRFIHGEKSADVLICFKCYDLWAANEQPHRLRDFYAPEAQRIALVKIAKALFPSDAELQRIREDN